MPSTAYNNAAAAFTKQVQWLVEIDLDRCAENYTTAPCTASDAGDGSRCWYSFFTCQDIANYNRTTRTYRFCLNEVPWPDPATAVYPLLRRLVSVPQRVSPSKLFAYPEMVELEFAYDFNPPAVDSDKTLFNTTTAGEFWRNLFARNKNYPGRPVRIKRGFNASGFVLSDFEQVGPEYLLKAVKYGRDGVVIEAESPLVKLEKRQIPYAISKDNVLQADINDSVTSLTVNDASEFPDPADFSRNTLYIEIDSEIMSYTTRDTGTNTLSGLTRGAFGTSAASHLTNAEVKHVCCFGTAAGAAVNPIDTIRDLLEWAGVASADVNTTAFDKVKNGAWPESDVSRIVRKGKKVAKLVQEIREIRGVIIYIDAGGQFAAAVLGPNSSGTTYDDDYFLEDSVGVTEDDEERITRVSMYYNPTDDSASEPDDYQDAVIVIDTDLENANSFGDVRDDFYTDKWLDPDTGVSSVRALAKRLIVRKRYGIRSYVFRLDAKDAELNVGDTISIQTARLTGLTGNEVVRPALITGKKEVGLAVNEYEAVDTNYSGAFFRISPDTGTENYDSATDDDKQYGYQGDNNNRVGTQNLDGYVFW